MLAVCLPGQSAEAGCGEYVVVNGRAVHAHGGMALDGSPHDRNSGDRLPECHGPNCRRQPPLAPPKPVFGGAGAEQWLFWPAVLDEQTPKRGLLVSQADARLACGHYPALERPPRRLSAF